MNIEYYYYYYLIFLNQFLILILVQSPYYYSIYITKIYYPYLIYHTLYTHSLYYLTNNYLIHLLYLFPLCTFILFFICVYSLISYLFSQNHIQFLFILVISPTNSMICNIYLYLIPSTHSLHRIMDLVNFSTLLSSAIHSSIVLILLV